VARGLEDFSISRSRTRARDWGIPVPGDRDQVVYVWFDALTNYVTALGYGQSGDERLYRRYWQDSQSRVHVIGKDILRFHAVYWPAMLLSAGAVLPTTIFVHGFLTRDGRKMSKSLGNRVDPIKLAETWGVDAVRYWLLRHVPATGDADFNDDVFSRAYSAELADGLGNLISRVIGMLHRYRAGVVPAPADAGDGELGDRGRISPPTSVAPWMPTIRGPRSTRCSRWSLAPIGTWNALGLGRWPATSGTVTRARDVAWTRCSTSWRRPAAWSPRGSVRSCPRPRAGSPPPWVWRSRPAGRTASGGAAPGPGGRSPPSCFFHGRARRPDPPEQRGGRCERRDRDSRLAWEGTRRDRYVGEST
jgi:hypothetical protein